LTRHTLFCLVFWISLFPPAGFGGEIIGPDHPLLRWKLETGGPLRSAPAAGPDGTIVFGSDDGILRAARPDGTLRWTVSLDSPIRSAPVLAPDGTVFVGAEDRRLYALTAEGRISWAAEFAAPVRCRPALSPDGAVIITAGSVIAALNGNGAPRWQWGTDRKVLSDPVVLPDGGIAMGADGGYLLVHQPDGSPDVARRVGLKFVSSPAVAPDGNLYLGSGANALMSVSADGIRNWIAGSGNHRVGPPAVGPDGMVVAGSDNGYVFARTAAGEKKWAVRTGDWITTRPVVDAEGKVYAGSWDGSLYAVDPAGAVRWRFETGGPIEADPLLAPDGTLLVPSADGTLYALGGPADPPVLVVETRNRVDGAPLSDVAISLESASGDTQSGVTGPAATAAFHLAPGEWRARAEADGFEAQTVSIIPEAPQRRLRLHLAPSGPLHLPEGTLPQGKTETEYAGRFPLSGGTPPYRFSIVEGKLPEGIALDAAAGTLAGTAAESGVYEMVVAVTDANGHVARRTFTVEMAGTLQLASDEPLPEAMVGFPYEHHLDAEGGLPPIRFFPDGENAIPAGLKLAETGRLSGVPETAEAATVSVKIQSRSQEVSAEWPLSVAERLRVTTAALPDAVVGAPYDAEVEIAGGTGERTVELSGTPPAGLRLEGNRVQGTAVGPGDGSIQALATDENGWKAAKTFPISAVAPLSLAEGHLPAAPLGEEYREAIPIAGGMPPYTVEIRDPLPAGLSLDAETGEIVGTPAEAVWTNVRVSATDAAIPPRKLEGILGVRVESLP
jgi:outer membrane protein assembly factor BamB